MPGRTFAELVSSYPPEVQALARGARALIVELLPKAEESVDRSAWKKDNR